MTYDEDDNNQKGDPSKILLPFSQSRVSTSSKNLKNVSKVYHGTVEMYIPGLVCRKGSVN